MLRWLQNVFRIKRDPYSSLPHFARVWLATEIAALFAPHFKEQWPESPERYSRRLRWSQAALRRHISGVDDRPRLIRIAVTKSMGVAGAAIRHHHEDASHFATITRRAAQAAERGPAESQACLDDILSSVADCTEICLRPDLWERVDRLAEAIARHAIGWDDHTKVPARLVESMAIEEKT